MEARFVNGSANNGGRVELLYNGTWASICGNGSDENMGEVLCRQLGFQQLARLGVARVLNSSDTPADSLNGEALACTGDETNIAYCNGTLHFNMQTPCMHATYLSLECDGSE